MQTLYVEPLGSSWHRPVRQITKQVAPDSLIEAIADYMTFLKDQPNSPRNRAFQAWAGCPSFPMPKLDFFK